MYPLIDMAAIERGTDEYFLADNKCSLQLYYYYYYYLQSFILLAMPMRIYFLF